MTKDSLLRFSASGRELCCAIVLLRMLQCKTCPRCPAGYIAHLARAYTLEKSPSAKDAIAQILTNSRMSAMGHRPICQDTGIVNVFLKMGMNVRLYEFDVVDMPVTVAVDAAGTSVHNTGPAEWQKRIATGEFKGIAVTAG